jgi:hypothetical protein
MAASQLFRIPAVRLHPVAGLYRNQRRCHNLTFHSECDELPVKYVTGRTGLVAGSQFLHRPEFPDHLADRFQTVGDRSNGANLASRFGYRDCYRFGMDIQSRKRNLVICGQLLSYAALRRIPQSQRNPRYCDSGGWSLHLH